MDPGDSDGSLGDLKPHPIPADLPTSLDDRRPVSADLVPETEMYDGWQGPSSALPPLQLPHARLWF